MLSDNMIVNASSDWKQENSLVITLSARVSNRKKIGVRVRVQRALFHSGSVPVKKKIKL